MTTHTCYECTHRDPDEDSCLRGLRHDAYEADACCYAFEPLPVEPKRGDVMELRNTPEWWWVEFNGEAALRAPNGMLSMPSGSFWSILGCEQVALLGPCVAPEKMETEE